jgi:hypothetical protein
MSALLPVRRFVRPRRIARCTGCLELEVVEMTATGALLVGPKTPLPQGTVLAFRSGPFGGWFVVDRSYDEVDPGRTYHAVRAVGPDAVVRQAEPWFAGAQWLVHLHDGCTDGAAT